MTYEEIVALEPRLAPLEKRIPAIVESTPRGSNGWRIWFNIRWEFNRLVGWNSGQKDIATSEAYDRVYDRLWAIFEPLAEARHLL